MQECISTLIHTINPMNPQQSVSYLANAYVLAQSEMFYAVENSDIEGVSYWSHIMQSVYNIAKTRHLAKDMMYAVADMTKYRG